MPELWTIRRGTIDDYRALRRFHYLAGEPATRVLVLAADGPDGPAGVLVVSMPTLNGSWRASAWPGWAPPGEPARDAAARLNAGLRTVSRVIVDPRWRGLGVAASLVRAYLARPLAERTEAIAAIGRFCPFFARAGMRRVEAPVRGHAATLLRRLSRLGVEASAWVERGEADRHAAQDPALVALVRAWARGSRATAGWADAGGGELLTRAALRLEARPEVYVSP